jgi:hypothetical protein
VKFVRMGVKFVYFLTNERRTRRETPPDQGVAFGDTSLISHRQ